MTMKQGGAEIRRMDLEQPSSALFTDLYQLTMARAYLRSGKAGEAVFSLFIRQYPPDRGYFVFAGLEDALAYLEGFRFSGADIEHLRIGGRFDESFLDSLAGVSFSGSVRAMREGSVFFAGEPVMEVRAPLPEAQLVETRLINIVNMHTILATKASRVVEAARGRPVVDFAARRTHGMEASYAFARSSYIAGFGGTSNVGAAATYGIRSVGTMAHSFITAFDSETEAFREYARSFPDDCTLLVDTYDTVEGVRRAIEVAREMRERGQRLRAVRLDSGDLDELARRARAMLDEAGFPEVGVFASGGLDEFEIDALLSAGAPIDGFGVGTKAGVSADAPWTDCAYKMVEYEGRPVMKLSSAKVSAPGPKQAYRFRDANGVMRHDVLAGAGEPAPRGGTGLLAEVMRGGRRVASPPSLADVRERCRRDIASLPAAYRALRSPARYAVGVSDGLRRLGEETAARVRSGG